MARSPQSKMYKPNRFARCHLTCRIDPTHKDALTRLRAEEQHALNSSSTSKVLFAAQGLELEKQW